MSDNGRRTRWGNMWEPCALCVGALVGCKGEAPSKRSTALASAQLASEVPIVAGHPLGYRGCDRVCAPMANCMLAKLGQAATDCATDATVECPVLIRDTPQYRDWWLSCNYECNKTSSDKLDCWSRSSPCSEVYPAYLRGECPP